jgi:hypothetical protein
MPPRVAAALHGHRELAGHTGVMVDVSKTPPREAYRSAADLPSYRKLSQELRAGKLLALFIGREHRASFKEVERGVAELVETVDRFYTVLGPRHWVFHDSLPVSEVRDMLSLDAEEAEQAFIRIHTDGDRLDWWVGRNSHRDGLRERASLMELALEDYKAGRYYSTVLVLIGIIDGFVNDTNKGARRGLHARDVEEMKTWDKVSGHHMGLTNVIPVFQQTFKKTTDRPVHELYRNGIVHGNLTNFNNVTVATKAWNYLAAVVDWAEDLKEQKREDPVAPTWAQIGRQLKTNQENKRELEAWTASTLEPGAEDWSTNPLRVAVEDFLGDWSTKRFGRLVDSLRAGAYKGSTKPPAGEMRVAFQDHQLDGYEVLRLDFTAPIIAEVSAVLSVDGQTFRSKSRWFFEGEDGEFALPGSGQGRWFRAFNGPEGFLNNAYAGPPA